MQQQPPTRQSNVQSPARQSNVDRPTGFTAGQQNRIIDLLSQLVANQTKTDSSQTSWNSQRGPQRGVRWRGGTPPSPPQGRNSADLRAFARWERKVEVWALQVKAFMPPSDAALMLFTSLTGEAELETEHLDLSKVNSADGIQYLVDTLREPLQQKLLFQKRKLLSDYEHIARFQNESVRQFANRYVRIEKDLSAIGISTAAMYDSESRGNRLLERCRLTPDLQRLVLIGAGNSLEFEKVRESLNFQFPDFRPSPPLAGSSQTTSKGGHTPYKGGKGGKGQYALTSNPSNFSQSSSPTTASSSTSYRPSSKGQYPRRVYQTDQVDEMDQIPEESYDPEPSAEPEFLDAAEEFEPEDDPEAPDQEPDDDPAEDDSQELQNLASVLTVTSKKLQSTVLGRKFTGRPRTIEERKRTSTCTACGMLGHWAGDAVCSMSNKDKPSTSKGAGKFGKDGKGGKGSVKKAFVVHVPGETDPDPPPEPGTSSGTPSTLGNPSTYFTFMAAHVIEQEPFQTYVTEIISLAGYMIVDTACQRGIHRASTRAYLPAMLPGQRTQGNLVKRVMSLFLRTLRSMSRMIGMGMAPRAWLTMLEQHIIAQEDQSTRALRSRPLPALCSHPEFRRYGNRTGRYSQCLQCFQKFKFNDEEQGWDLFGGPSSQPSSPLPLPSPSNILSTDKTKGKDNTNYVNGPEELAAWRTQVRPMIEKMVRWCEKQDEEGAYGALNSKGAMIRKGHNFAGNCPLVLAHLQKKLSQEQQRLCTPLEGRETSLSQEYCPGLVRAIVTGLLDTAQHHDPNRFHTASKTFSTYAVDRFQVNDDLDSWQPILDMVERLFKHTTQRTLLLPHSDPVCQEVKKLVPWHSIERIQVAIQPTLHRFPAHIPHTHRGSALLYNDGTIEIVTEDLAELRFPKGRFQKPVNIGIFWFGLALPIEQQAQPSVEVQPPVEPPPPPDTVDDNPLHRVGMDEMDISFPHDRKYDQSTKTVVSRLHRNLGHPPATELKKLLAMNGIKNQTILAAVDDMTCASCQRARMPTRPSPAAIPDTGLRQFADSIQLDIVYIRDIAGSNFPVLGVIDECTLLHQAAVLDSRLPSEVLKKFIRIWAQPFGYPLIARLDPDGSFRGEFEEFMDTTGTQTDFIPPEAHHRLGLIERHNATLRDIAERIIDSNAITGPEQMELAITNTVFSKNACTWSTGRPPFIAAFGRIPRHGGLDLLSDDHSLTTGGTQQHMHQLADVLRSEAQQHIAAMKIDGTFRRALLRKTHPQPQQQLTVGETIAYWRWTTRSQKKRGGYKLARLLGLDPDGKSLWVQSGTNTVKIAREQARQAYGEAWNPDPTDLRALRSASENIRSGLFEDETLPVADDPDQPLGNDDHLRETEPDVVLPLYTPTPPPQLQVVPHTPLPPEPQQPQLPPQITMSQAQQQQNNMQNITIEVSSPTYNQQTIQLQHADHTFGMTSEQLRRPAVRTPVRRPHRSRTPSRAAPPLGDTAPHEQARLTTAGTVTPPLPVPAIDTSQVPIPVSDDEPDNLGTQVPQTPEELRQPASIPATAAGSTSSRMLPAKRPGSPLPDTHRTRELEGHTSAASTSRHTTEQRHAEEKPHSSLATVHTAQGNPHCQPTANTVVRVQQYSPEHCKFHRTAQQAPMNASDEGITLIDKHFDGTTDIYMPYPHTACFQAYKASASYTGDGVSDDTDASQDNMSTSVTPGQPLTRQQQKALDKELPWRVIVDKGGDYLIRILVVAQETLQCHGWCAHCTFLAWSFSKNTTFPSSMGLVKAPMEWQLFARYSGSQFYTRGLLLVDRSHTFQAMEFTSEECTWRFRAGDSEDWSSVESGLLFPSGKDQITQFNVSSAREAVEGEAMVQSRINLEMNTERGIRQAAQLYTQCRPGEFLNFKLTMYQRNDIGFAGGELGQTPETMASSEAQTQFLSSKFKMMKMRTDTEFEVQKNWMVLGGSTVADAYFKRDENHQGEAHLATATCTDSQEQEAVRICTKHLQKEDTLDSEVFENCVFDVCHGGGEVVAELLAGLSTA
ncbi:Integrase catalytic domain-containing protein [Durusdinium trenchii]|uniref:Integrase catalytic domain-containing protein n=1 Tax=Durusdinium trenchii TaxID=1381693 RepID=A0ABP0JGM9_9DINO